jgi:LysR family transcriptional regulator, low CO2-responsive transcriptional regulator
VGEIMTLHQLRILESVARHLSVTRASQELHMSQPAVSQQLRLLEQEYEAKFVVRIGQGVELTERGRAFLDAVRPVIAQVAEVESTFKAKSNEKKSSFLTVGGSRNHTVTVLPEKLWSFKQNHPWVQFVLESNDSYTMEQHVLNGDVQIALINHPSHFDRIAYEPYREMEIVAFALAKSPLIGKKISLDELFQIPLVVRRRSTTLRELLREGYRPNVAVECDVSEAVKAAVQRELGVGILYRDTVEADLKNRNFKILHVAELEAIRTQSFIIYNRSKPLSAIAQDFLYVLQESRVSKVQSPTASEKFRLDRKSTESNVQLRRAKVF